MEEEQMNEKELSELVRDVPDFPKPGIVFKDITTLIGNKDGFKSIINILFEKYKDAKIDKVACIESRGFIFGAALAEKLDAGVILIRKPGKLPYKAITEEYELEYGTDSLQVHIDAAAPDENVLIIDDLLATGGTAAAAVRLIERLGAKVVGVAFVIELTFLNGIDKIKSNNPFTIIKY